MKNQEIIQNAIMTVKNDFNNRATIDQEYIFDLVCDLTLEAGLAEETDDQWYMEFYLPVVDACQQYISK